MVFIVGWSYYWDKEEINEMGL